MATKEETATKGDTAGLRAELKAGIGDVRTQVASIRRDPDELSHNVGDVISCRREIDPALDRIAAIEKQFGMTKTIAA